MLVESTDKDTESGTDKGTDKGTDSQILLVRLESRRSDLEAAHRNLKREQNDLRIRLKEVTGLLDGNAHQRAALKKQIEKASDYLSPNNLKENDQ